MSQLSGSFAIETERLARELALAVVAELDRVDLVGALADAIVARMGGSTGYVRPEEPGPGAGGRHGGARFGSVTDGGLQLEEPT